MDKVLVLYDLTGHIWNIVYGAEEAPQGIPSIWVDMPENAVIDHVDPVTKEPVFTYLPETDLGQLQQEVRSLDTKVTEAGATVEALQGDTATAADDITNLQIALAEVYEMLAPEE